MLLAASASPSPTMVVCVAADADDRDCDETTALADDCGTVTFDTPTAAYYTLWASARDQAGNRSAEVSHTFVFDN